MKKTEDEGLTVFETEEVPRSEWFKIRIPKFKCPKHGIHTHAIGVLGKIWCALCIAEKLEESGINRVEECG